MLKHQHYSKLGLVGVLLMLFVVASPALSQTTEAPVFAYSQGVLQPDNSILYSVLVVSDEQAVNELTVKMSLPEAALSNEIVIVPEGATLISDADEKDALIWQVDELAAASVLGPFTIRVRLPETTVDVPASLPAVITWTAPEAGSLDANQPEGILEPADLSASITLDAAGTVDENGEPTILNVANTDIWIHVPEGALSQSVTLVFSRIIIDDANIPPEMSDIWWCVLVMIESDTDVTLAKPITIALPTRQILTPGIDVQVLVQNGSDEWQTLDTVQGLSISGTGTHAGVMIADTIPQMIAVGVTNKIRQESVGAAPACGGFRGFNSGFNSGGGGGSSFNGGASFGGGGFNSGFNSGAGGGFNAAAFANCG